MGTLLRFALVSDRDYGIESFSSWRERTASDIEIVPIEARLSAETAVTVGGA